MLKLKQWLKVRVGNERWMMKESKMGSEVKWKKLKEEKGRN